MKWLFLVIAIIAEIVATSALKASEAFTRLWPSVLVVGGYAMAFFPEPHPARHTGRDSVCYLERGRYSLSYHNCGGAVRAKTGPAGDTRHGFDNLRGYRYQRFL